MTQAHKKNKTIHFKLRKVINIENLYFNSVKLIFVFNPGKTLLFSSPFKYFIKISIKFSKLSSSWKIKNFFSVFRLRAFLVNMLPFISSRQSIKVNFYFTRQGIPQSRQSVNHNSLRPLEIDYSIGFPWLWRTPKNSANMFRNQKVWRNLNENFQYFLFIYFAVLFFFFTARFSSSCKTEAKWMFGHLDTNSDGYLSTQELFSLEHDKVNIFISW